MIVGVLGAVVLGAGSVASASLPATKDPCKLLKQAEITRVIGLTVGPADAGSSTPGVIEQCYWSVQPSGEIAGGDVGTALLTSNPTLGDMKTYFEGKRQAAPNATPAPGVKKSFYDPDSGEVSVLRGDQLLKVSLQLYDTSGTNTAADHSAELTKLTKKAVKRLG